MAFTVNSPVGGGIGRRRFRGGGTLSDINIVPLVDVVMVLLIIFMLTAHVMEFGLEVDVPKVITVRESAQELPVVTITREGEMYLNEKPVNINEVGEKVRERFGAGAKAVYVRADKDTTWDPIAQAVSALSEAKLDVKMVTKPTDEAEKKRK